MYIVYYKVSIIIGTGTCKKSIFMKMVAIWGCCKEACMNHNKVISFSSRLAGFQGFLIFWRWPCSRSWGVWDPWTVCNEPLGCLHSKSVSQPLCALAVDFLMDPMDSGKSILNGFAGFLSLGKKIFSLGGKILEFRRKIWGFIVKNCTSVRTQLCLETELPNKGKL